MGGNIICFEIVYEMQPEVLQYACFKVLHHIAGKPWEQDIDIFMSRCQRKRGCVVIFFTADSVIYARPIWYFQMSLKEAVL